MDPYYDQDGITIYHGDALRVLPELSLQVNAVISDPPYSTGGAFRTDRTRNGQQKYQSWGTLREFPEFAGDTRDQRSFAMWCTLWLGECLDQAAPGCAIALFSDWRQLPTTTDALQAAGWVWRGLAVWDKTEGARPQRGRFRQQTEFVAWGSAGPMGNEGPCLPGVFRSSVSGTGNEKQHLAGKPLSVMKEICAIAWRPGSLILDPFVGSGTTLRAAKDLGLRAVGIELVEEICEVAAKRLDQKTFAFGELTV
ncbi:MAG: site-specific DNA-methyltransferase [Patescibacteria group bacterium]|nr:site-specific DNA-methyltransferase [Patescibacteria group bacterium]